MKTMHGTMEYVEHTEPPLSGGSVRTERYPFAREFDAASEEVAAPDARIVVEFQTEPAFNRAGRGVLSLVSGQSEQESARLSDAARRLAAESDERLSPNLPDLRVLDNGQFDDAPSRVRICVSLDATRGTKLLPSVSGFIGASLSGRVPFVMVDDELMPTKLFVTYCVEDSSPTTVNAARDFAAAAVRFLALPEDASFSVSIETDDQRKSRIPEHIRRQFGI